MIPDFKTYINESIWGDLARRSGGTQVRAEDDINNLDIEEFVQYLKDNYEVCIPDPNNFFQIGIWYVGGSVDGVGNISIPIEKNDVNETPNMSNRMLVIKRDLKSDDSWIMPNKFIFRLYPRELQKAFGDKYDIDASEFTITPKNGVITNSVYIDVIDKLLGIVERPILKKKS